MSFFSSWWSPQPNEEKKDVESEPKAEGNDPNAMARPSDWMSGFESTLRINLVFCQDVI